MTITLTRSPQPISQGLRAAALIGTLSGGASVIALDLVALHPLHPVLFVIPGAAGLCAAALRPHGVVRLLAWLMAAYAVVIGLQTYRTTVRFAERRAHFEQSAAALKKLQKSIFEYHAVHPAESYTNLSDYLRLGVIEPVATNLLAGAAVTVHPYLKNGTDADPFLDIRKGNIRTIVSQVGGVFQYNVRQTRLVGAADTPSPDFTEAVESYREVRGGPWDKRQR